MSHLTELATQVRTTTIQLVELVPADWLLWAPTGTSNHITWHAGHAVWVQDCLCIEPLTGNSELTPGWPEKFGMNCRPVAQTTDWPNRDQLLHKLHTQLDRLLVLLEEHADQLIDIGPNPPDRWDLTRGIIHALHDEARHQGEMNLLRKLQEAQQR
jgi:hypothetical protein